MKKPEIILGVAVLAAIGVLLYSHFSSASSTPTMGGGGPSPLPGGGAGPSRTDSILQSSGGLMSTSQAQAMLKALGPAAGSSAMTNIKVNGTLDVQTLAGIKSYQSIKGIKVDGIVGPQTATTLANDYNALRAQLGS